MQVPPFLLDEWLNEYHFRSAPPEFDLASSTGPPWTIRDGVTAADLQIVTGASEALLVLFFLAAEPGTAVSTAKR